MVERVELLEDVCNDSRRKNGDEEKMQMDLHHFRLKGVFFYSGVQTKVGEGRVVAGVVDTRRNNREFVWISMEINSTKGVAFVRQVLGQKAHVKKKQVIWQLEVWVAFCVLGTGPVIGEQSCEVVLGNKVRGMVQE